MKAVLIDAYRQRVVDVETDGSLQAIYDRIQCDSIDGAVYFDNHDCIYVDGDGLCKDVDYGFIVRLVDGPARSPHQSFFAGCGILCGSDRSGEAADAKLTADELRPLIVFGRVSPDACREVGAMSANARSHVPSCYRCEKKPALSLDDLKALGGDDYGDENDRPCRACFEKMVESDARYAAAEY